MPAAPIARALLEPVLAPRMDGARTLPPEAYTSVAVFEWETEHLFEQGWVCVGRADELTNPGDQRASRIGREGVLVVRDHDHVLRGFYNTCRHRGHELLEPGTSRNLRAIKCPYHAWVYQLDGQLGAAPRFGDLEGFDKAEYPLVGARIAEWHGWVFVNAGGASPAFAEHVGDLEQLIAPWEAGRMFVAETRTYEVAANWKTITEHYHEWSHRPAGVSSFGLFPNLLLSLYPDYVMAHRIEPLEPGRTRVECLWLFPPEAGERPDFSPASATEFWDMTNREDWLACESVYRGLQSRGFHQGSFAWSEDEVHLFMAMVARAYVDGHASRLPQVHVSSSPDV